MADLTATRPAALGGPAPLPAPNAPVSVRASESGGAGGAPVSAGSPSRRQPVDGGLETVREIVDAGVRGLTRAENLLAQAHAVRSAGPLDEQSAQRTLALGSDLLSVSSVSARGIGLLSRDETLHFPQGDVPSFELVGSSDAALIHVDPFLPTTEPHDAAAQLQEAAARVAAARATLEQRRDDVDALALEAAREQSSAQAPDSALALQGIDAGRLAAVHDGVDARATVTLLMP